ncbi:alpha/beta hydrolase [Loktanella sp. S4079]|uniref:alpha/beta hydrolase n=1 Tax=Loktanella sp. S4079 TaxID=579483 RepID=UPI0005F9CC3F|nr:alpha/beta hydrolase [Loktanella sp. S4079]KJZ18566.1 hypothetical protein TW80_14200 [Loktanella sp. S4079]
MTPAPFHLEQSEGPADGRAYWVNADDGTRLRVGFWNAGATPKGTILVFPGRTEYIEKYGITANDFTARGYGLFIIDWRGQGLSDRKADDRMTGHVDSYADFQQDVAAMIKAAQDLDLPKPWYLFGHSMGGCIGLRALTNGLPVVACAFTAPMWQVKLPLHERIAAWPVSWAAQKLGQGHRYAPGTSGVSYVLNTEFQDNRLTHNPEMFAYFQRQARALPDHQIGGPSLGWLFQTLIETAKLGRCPSPDLPCVTFYSSNDVLVAGSAIERRMRNWPKGRLEPLAASKHDMLSEVDEIRMQIIEATTATFSAAAETLAD